MDKYGWIDQLLAGLRDQAPEQDPAAAHRMELWISEQIDQLRRGSGDPLPGERLAIS